MLTLGFVQIKEKIFSKILQHFLTGICIYGNNA